MIRTSCGVQLRQDFEASVSRARPPGTLGCLTIIASLLLGVTGTAAAQSYHPMRFEHITLDDGLSQSNVLSILQDSDGRMWFGTENGLNSYDGYEFRHYRHERGNPSTLGSDFVFDIREDRDGNLWVATNGGGLARLEAGSRNVTSFRHDPADRTSISSNIVRRILIDTDGTIWLGTRGDGLDHFDPETGEATHVRFQTGGSISQSANEIYALFKDSKGALWVGSNDGLMHLDIETGALHHFDHDADDPSALGDPRVRAIFEDSQSRIWVGTYGGGLYLLDRETQSFTAFVHDPSDTSSIASNRVSVIFEDADDRLWVGTSQGLNLFDSKSRGFVRYSNDGSDVTSLGDNAVSSIYQDRGGVVWIGTQNRGLSKWNPSTWGLGFTDSRQLSTDVERPPNVTSFLEDRSGTLWVGTFGDGLSAVDRNAGTTRHFRHDPASPGGLNDNRVMSLLEDRQGSIWIGTMTGGINRLDPQTGAVEQFRHDAQNAATLSADGIMALFEDSQGYVWVGTFGGGISRFDPTAAAFERFPASLDSLNGPSSNRVTSFAEDPSGMMWIGTDGGGLNLYDPESQQFHRFRHDPNDPRALAADTVYAVTVDAAGTIWVGTRGGGLDRVVGDVSAPATIEFENLSQADGLANNVVYGVQYDDTGHLWLSTNYGLSQFNPVDRTVKNLHRLDGLQSEEFNFGAHYRSADGELFFGGHNGFNAFRPEDLEDGSVIPPLVLTNYVDSDGRVRADSSFDADAGIDLSYRDDTVSFEVAALDYSAPERNQYMYKLEGFDRDWNELGNNRRITFTDLDAGDYLLRVKAASSSGVWNESGLSLPIQVSPAPWNTWWAYIGYLAMLAQLVALLWLGHRRRLRREEEYSKRLELEVRRRTEELREGNERLRRANLALQESSLSDPLTGLRNRRFVFEEMSRDLEVVRRKIGHEAQGVDSKSLIDLVFMMIDLDSFKPINDTYGHAAGDQMLLEVRDVLLKSCRKSDFVVRWGGDEFVVIAKQARPGEAEALAERIRSRVADHRFTLGDGQVVRTTVSIGFAAYPLFQAQADDASLDQIMNLADNLMYEAKKNRNAWVGMMSPSDAVASASFDVDSLDPTSVLFRSHRAGKLLRHDADGDDAGVNDLRIAS